jgi:hypothetical protein
MKRLVAVLLAALPVAADSVVTRCDSTSFPFDVDLHHSTVVRTLGSCGADKSANALWHLDRLDSGDGSLDGKYERIPVHALVYVIDTGVQSDHVEFADGSVVGGIDVAPAGATKCTQPATHMCIESLADTHGTGVASMIGGKRVGVAPGVSIVSVFTAGGSSPQVFLNAFNGIIQNAWDPATLQVKTAVVNMSNQLGPASTANDAVVYAQIEAKMRDMVAGVDRDGKRDPNGKRFLFTISAGNAAAPQTAGGNRGQCGPNYEVILFPAALGKSIAGVITVGGTSKTNTSWVDTCRGDGVELLAPAEDIFAAINTANTHYRMEAASGTSWSAPIVAGVAARYLTANPDLTPAELEAKLEASPTAVTDSFPGPSGGRVVFVGAPIHPRRRGAVH